MDVVRPLSAGASSRAPRFGRSAPLLLLVLLGCWFLPWADVQTADGGIASRRGYALGGPAAAGALLVAWGLASALRLGRHGARLRRLAGLADGVTALGVAALLAAHHPWLGAGMPADAYLPVFLPLGLLGVLEAATASDRGRREIGLVRAGASSFAGLALLLDHHAVAGAAALFLGASAALTHAPTTDRALRRTLDLRLLVAAGIAILAPEIQDALAGESYVAAWYVGRFGWEVAAGLVALLALRGVVRPAGGASAAP